MNSNCLFRGIVTTKSTASFCHIIMKRNCYFHAIIMNKSRALLAITNYKSTAHFVLSLSSVTVIFVPSLWLNKLLIFAPSLLKGTAFNNDNGMKSFIYDQRFFRIFDGMKSVIYSWWWHRWTVLFVLSLSTVTVLFGPSLWLNQLL